MATQHAFTREQILNALTAVKDPDLNRNIVELGFVQNLELNTDAGEVRFNVVLTTPACPVKDQLQAECVAAVSKISGVQKVEVKMTAEVRPLKMPEPQNAQATPRAGYTSGPIPGVAHVIAVSSGKGGVGKSTAAVNLATALALEGARVGLMDADVYGPNIPTMMGVTEQPKLIQDAERGELFVPPMNHGVKIMSMGFLVGTDQPLIWRGPMLHNIVNQFCFKVEWGNLDYLVVDMPPGTGDVQLSLAQLVPITGAVLVTTPQEVSMQDVRKAYAMFEKVRVPVLGFVENMSYFQPKGSNEKHYIFGKDGGSILARKFNTKLLAQIPLVQEVREGGDEGRPIVVRDPSSAIALTFRELAKSVAQSISILAASGKSDPTQSISIGSFN